MHEYTEGMFEAWQVWVGKEEGGTVYHKRKRNHR